MKFDNLDELHIVLACQETGTLTAAAGRLNLTPAAASASLKKLEARLGVRLFERSTRRMRITPAGELLADYARRAIDLLTEAQAQLTEDQRHLVGLIRISAPSDLTRRVLMPWLDEFMAQHLGVEVQLAVSDTLSDVIRDQVDVALRYGELDDSRLVARRLAFARRVVCAAPDYLARHGTPQHPQELAQHECLTFQIRGKRALQWTFERSDPSKGSEKVTVRVHGRRSADDAEIVHRWALAGHGIIYKSALDVHAHIQSGALVHLLQDWEGIAMPVHAVLPSGRFLSARVRALVDFLAGKMAGLDLPGSLVA